MIRGIHAMFYSSAAEELRVFLRDVLELPSCDVGEGWLIFQAPEAEIGAHPDDAGKGCPPGTHSISFYCDDLPATVAALERRGVEFTDGVTDAGFGRITHFRMPGGIIAELYQPRYEATFD